MTRIGLRHWLVVLGIALAAHAALLIRFQVEDTRPSANTGGAGVRIALAPTQGKPQPEQVAANAAEQKDTPDEQSAPPSEPKTEPQPEPKPKSAPESEPAPESVPEPEPKPSPVQEPEPASETKPKPQPKPEPKPEPKLQPQPAPQTAPMPKPKPEQQHDPKSMSSQPTRTARQADEAKPASGRDRNNAPAQAAQTAEHTQQSTTGSVSDTPADYRSKLSAALQRYKNYPRRARRLGQEGTVVLYFVVDRSGRVLDWKIRKSSGHEILDEAVRDMIRKANPLPALPDSVSMQRLALTVPISFRLQ